MSSVHFTFQLVHVQARKEKALPVVRNWPLAHRNTCLPASRQCSGFSPDCSVMLLLKSPWQKAEQCYLLWCVLGSAVLWYIAWKFFLEIFYYYIWVVCIVRGAYLQLCDRYKCYCHLRDEGAHPLTMPCPWFQGAWGGYRRRECGTEMLAVWQRDKTHLYVSLKWYFSTAWEKGDFIQSPWELLTHWGGWHKKTPFLSNAGLKGRSCPAQPTVLVPRDLPQVSYSPSSFCSKGQEVDFLYFLYCPCLSVGRCADSCLSNLQWPQQEGKQQMPRRWRRWQAAVIFCALCPHAEQYPVCHWSWAAGL